MKLFHSISAALLFALALPLSAAPVEEFTVARPGNFGYGEAIALSGDTLVVSHHHGHFSSALGEVFVYVRSGGTWTQQAVLTASNGDGQDRFGESVAISGDRIIVGAPRERSNAGFLYGNQADNSVVGAGAAYIFKRNGTTWTQQAYLKAPIASADLRFGGSVAISGTRAVVGTGMSKEDWSNSGFASGFAGEDSNATGVDGDPTNTGAPNSGAAFVYSVNGEMWKFDAYLKASNTGTKDAFGFAVAIDGDLIVVGAPGETSAAVGVNGNQADNSLPHAGAAYVFARANETWVQQAYLKPDVHAVGPTGISSGFGSAVAVSGTTVVVGTVGEMNTENPIGGKAWVFTRSPVGVWTQEQALAPLVAGSYFGYSVGISGDTLVVGQINEGDVQFDFNSGEIHVFTRNAGLWTRQAVANPSTDAPQAALGFCLAVDGGTFAMGTGITSTTYCLNRIWVYTGAGVPNIGVEQPGGATLASGGTTTTVGLLPGTSTDVVFTVRNTGTQPLALTGTPNRVALSGSSDFSVTAQPAATVSAFASTTFTVHFAPATAGLKTATLTIPSDDPDTSPYVINLSGRGLDFTTDTDGDGMSDAAELQLASLGFDWQSSQSALVTNYFANANNNGLYTTSQVQALHVGTPLIQRNQATGKFTLTIGVKKTAILGQPFADFPMTGPGTGVFINGAGKLEFEFPSPGNAAFFRLESQ